MVRLELISGLKGNCQYIGPVSYHPFLCELFNNPLEAARNSLKPYYFDAARYNLVHSIRNNLPEKTL